MTKTKLRTTISNVLNEYGIGPEYDHLRSEKDNLNDDDMKAIAERFCNFLVKQEFPYVDFVKAYYQKNDSTFKGGETIVVRAIVRSNEWKRERIEDTDMRGRKRVRYSDVPVYFFKHGFRGINLDKLFAGTKYLRNMKPDLDSDPSSGTRERYWFKMLLFWPKYNEPEKRKLVFQELKEWLDANENKTFSRDDFGFPPIKEEYLNEGKGSTMKITKRQLKRIIREEYSRLKRQGLIRESSDWRNRNKDIMEQAIDLATAKKAKAWWGKDLMLFGAVVELIESIDQVAQDTPVNAKAVANEIKRDETLRRAWSIAQSMYDNIPGAESHLEAVEEINSFRY